VRWHFNLSRNKSLRTLETTAGSIATAGEAASGFLKAVLSTIPPHIPLDIVITYRECDFSCFGSTWAKPVYVEYPLPEIEAENVQHSRRQFKVFRQMYRVREFRLVLCVDVLDCVVEDTMWALESIVEVERESGRLDYLVCEPLIISEMRVPRTRLVDGSADYGAWQIIASAL